LESIAALTPSFNDARRRREASSVEPITQADPDPIAAPAPFTRVGSEPRRPGLAAFENQIGVAVSAGEPPAAGLYAMLPFR
jgi:hypothetical protein